MMCSVLEGISIDSYDQWIQKEHKQFIPLPNVQPVPKPRAQSSSISSVPLNGLSVSSKTNSVANHVGNSANPIEIDLADDSLLDSFLEEDVINAILECEKDMMATSSAPSTTINSNSVNIPGKSTSHQTTTPLGNGSYANTPYTSQPYGQTIGAIQSSGNSLSNPSSNSSPPVNRPYNSQPCISYDAFIKYYHVDTANSSFPPKSSFPSNPIPNLSIPYPGSTPTTTTDYNNHSIPFAPPPPSSIPPPTTTTVPPLDEFTPLVVSTNTIEFATSPRQTVSQNPSGHSSLGKDSVVDNWI